MIFFCFSFISLVLHFLRGLKKKICMALTLHSPTTPPPSSSSSPHSPSISWLNSFFVDKEIHEISKKRVLEPKECKYEDFSPEVGKNILEKREYWEGKEKEKDFQDENQEGKSIKLRKRPTRLALPQYSPALGFGEGVERKMERKEFEVEGRDFFMASKKGRRDVMEDGYGVMLDILGDSKQAFFAVIDGHGGRAAADYVSENLGINIVKSFEGVDNKADNDQYLEAIRRGYLVTDNEFLSKGVGGGACAASVLLKNGELHVANVGDCRVVLCRNRVAVALTIDHRLSREDERIRIENSGGYVHCRNGVWRVNGSLAVSRAVGDIHLKEWIISDPEIHKLPLTPDCDFLIMASDGLWDKVNEQEAVDVVVEGKSSVESCKKLVDMSSSRGNIDDITVMVIDLQKFLVE